VPTPHSSNLPTRCADHVVFSFSLTLGLTVRAAINPCPSMACTHFRNVFPQAQHSKAFAHSLKNTRGYTPKSEPPAKPLRKNSDRCPFRPTQFSRSELDHAPYARHSTRTRLAALHDAAAIARCDISRPRTGLRVRRPHLAKRERKPTTQSRGTRGNGKRRSARQLDSKGKQRLEGNHFEGRKEGGQVPHSVRIQAPARQRGSVSP
jgi:hypothetical protein